MQTGWLLRDGEVLAAAELAERLGERSKGLLGRSDYDGAMVFRRTRSVHTLLMKFPIDVAILDAGSVVIWTGRLVPWRMCLPRRGGRAVVEARAGSFERWGLRRGDLVEFREAR